MKKKLLYFSIIYSAVILSTAQLTAQVLLTANGSNGAHSGTRTNPESYKYTNDAVIVMRSYQGGSSSNEIGNILDGTVPETGNTSFKFFAGIAQLIIRFEFRGTAPIVTKYVISGNAETATSALPRSPKDWTFEGSNDATSWTLLNTQTNQFTAPDPFTVETKTYTFTNTTAYKYYRLNITSNQTGTAAITVSEFELWGTVPTQPVNLTEFVVKNYNFSANLSWTTASEQNNSHFNILRSANGKDFELLTTLKGQGTSNEKNIYNYTDANPLSGTSYYKLVQVDFDGQSEEFKTQVLNMDLPFSEELVIIGTPEEQGIKALFFSPENTTGTLQLSDVSGRMIAEQTYQLHSGKNTVSLSAELQKGIYIATLKTEKDIRTVKFNK